MLQITEETPKKGFSAGETLAEGLPFEPYRKVFTPLPLSIRETARLQLVRYDEPRRGEYFAIERVHVISQFRSPLRSVAEIERYVLLRDIAALKRELTEKYGEDQDWAKMLILRKHSNLENRKLIFPLSLHVQSISNRNAAKADDNGMNGVVGFSRPFRPVGGRGVKQDIHFVPGQ